jgi:hypothetical protein
MALYGSRGRGSSVGIATGHWLDDRGSISSRGKKFVSTPQRADRFSGPPSLLSNRFRKAFTPRVKRPGHEDDHSTPSSAEVKDGRAIPPLPHTS